MTIEFHSEDNDNLRVYFRDGPHLCCWQQKGPFARHDFRYLECTLEGEPSHQVPPPADTPRNPGETPVGQNLNAFLGLRPAPPNERGDDQD